VDDLQRMSARVRARNGKPATSAAEEGEQAPAGVNRVTLSS
jgi:hypothetical protein